MNEEDHDSNHVEENQEVEYDSLDGYLLARDKERRNIIQPPARFGDSYCVAYALACAAEIDIDEPRTINEAMRDQNWKKWEHAMIKEMQSLEKTETWDIVSKLDRKKTVGNGSLN